MPRPARRSTRSHAPSRPVNPTRPIKSVVARPRAAAGPTAKALIAELGSCVTEADLVQVLYRGLQPKFGYDAILLQVLDREGWYHSLPIDARVLQDVRRRPLREATFAKQFEDPKTAVLSLESSPQQSGSGPGSRVQAKFAVWVPVMHQGEVIGSVSYQSYRKRRVPSTELTFLEEVHRRMGVLLANPSLNELTRNQARRLEALNSLPRAMTSTPDERRVLTGLYPPLPALLPVDPPGTRPPPHPHTASPSHTP